MRWIIRSAAFVVFLTIDLILIHAWIGHTVTHYQHTFWGQRG